MRSKSFDLIFWLSLFVIVRPITAVIFLSTKDTQNWELWEIFFPNIIRKFLTWLMLISNCTNVAIASASYFLRQKLLFAVWARAYPWAHRKLRRWDKLWRCKLRIGLVVLKRWLRLFNRWRITLHHWITHFSDSSSPFKRWNISSCHCIRYFSLVHGRPWVHHRCIVIDSRFDSYFSRRITPRAVVILRHRKTIGLFPLTSG